MGSISHTVISAVIDNSSSISIAVVLSSYLQQQFRDDVSVSQPVHQGKGVVHRHGDVGTQFPQLGAKVSETLCSGHAAVRCHFDVNQH